MRLFGPPELLQHPERVKARQWDQAIAGVGEPAVGQEAVDAARHKHGVPLQALGGVDGADGHPQLGLGVFLQV